MRIQVTTRDGDRYEVDPSTPENALSVFLEAADEEWVRVIAPISGTKGMFVRRSEVKLVEIIDEEDADEIGPIV